MFNLRDTSSPVLRITCSSVVVVPTSLIHTTAAVVTCGGLSPGLNNVIRSVFLELTHNYGVTRVLGIRNGYQGLNPEAGLPPIELTSQSVDYINNLGGTMLGSSRGPQEPATSVDTLKREGIDILLCVGGDGTQRGAHAIYDEIVKRKMPKAVVGIPKTIDNDISYVRMTFGYATALEKAAEVLRGAHVAPVVVDVFGSNDAVLLCLGLRVRHPECLADSLQGVGLVRQREGQRAQLEEVPWEAVLGIGWRWQNHRSSDHLIRFLWIHSQPCSHINTLIKSGVRRFRQETQCLLQIVPL